jgi:cyclopropane-fatty-acyl-phospholipid synthase
MTVAEAVERIVGPDLPIAIETYDGGRIGPADAPARLVVRSPDALRRILTAPGELGLGRAYVAGDLDVEGDMYAALRPFASDSRGFDSDRPSWWVSPG